MLDFMRALSTAASGMHTQTQRLRVVSENIANVDTPGYRRKILTFETVMGEDNMSSEVRIGTMYFDQAELRRAFEPTHPLANEEGEVTYSNVNLLTEITDAREAQRSFEANLNVFDQTRRMYNNVLELLRR